MGPWDGSSFYNKDAAQANARLIAAAPDLLAAAEGALQWLRDLLEEENPDSFEEACEPLRHAIAKARGEE